MKKIKNFINSKFKLCIGIIIGFIVSGGVAYAATIVLSSDEIGYDNSTSGASSTNVKDALDELYNIAITPISADGIENLGFTTNRTKVIMASPNGVCIIRKGKFVCFQSNNFAVEKEHILQVFSDVTCWSFSDLVDCPTYDFSCNAHKDGWVQCFDMLDPNPNSKSGCSVNHYGTINCT